MSDDYVFFKITVEHNGERETWYDRVLEEFKDDINAQSILQEKFGFGEILDNVAEYKGRTLRGHRDFLSAYFADEMDTFSVDIEEVDKEEYCKNTVDCLICDCWDEDEEDDEEVQ